MAKTIVDEQARELAEYLYANFFSRPQSCDESLIEIISIARHLRTALLTVAREQRENEESGCAEEGEAEERLLFASDVCRNQQLRINELEQRNKSLLRYADHLKGCASYTNSACTCGLENAIAEKIRTQETSK